MQDKKQLQALLQVLNQVFDMERKLEQNGGNRSLERNLRRIKQSFEQLGLQYHNPIGENYRETRTDCEATISGNSLNNLTITEVIKPIIRLEIEGFSQIVQRAVVIVEGR